MKHKSLKIGGIVVGALLALYLIVDFSLGGIVRAGVNRLGPRMTQTKVQLTLAHISPISGSGTLSGLFVGNPAGWTSDKAFYLGKIHVEVVPSSIFGDHIIVNEMDIENPEFVYETKVVSSNIGDLLKNMTGAKKTTEATTKTGKPIKFEVRHFHLTGGQVTLGVGPAAITLPMPPIDLTDLGTKEGGITSGELAVAIMRSMMSSVVKASTQAAGKIGSTMGAAAGSAVKQGGSSLKGLFGGKN